jgi:hypothetical protein
VLQFVGDTLLVTSVWKGQKSKSKIGKYLGIPHRSVKPSLFFYSFTIAFIIDNDGGIVHKS